MEDARILERERRQIEQIRELESEELQVEEVDDGESSEEEDDDKYSMLFSYWFCQFSISVMFFL